MTREAAAAEPDTIVAVATPMGESAIGVIRVSGPGALAVVAPLLRSPARLDALPSHTLKRIALVDPGTGDPLDEALCAVMRAPRSYTGEDIVELSCHGSPALLRLVVRRLLESGARLAEPGEFTRRAFLNGRLDLAQAEAVALVIGAPIERAVTLAARLTDAVAVASLTGAGIDRLVATLSDEVQRRASSEGDEGGIVASLRQTEALVALQRSLAGAEQALGRAPLEVALVDLRDALTQADGLLGIDTGDAVLDRIFSTFCFWK